MRTAEHNRLMSLCAPQSYKDFARLPRTLAVLYETLRLHPSVNIIPKYAAEDTILLDDPASWFEERERDTMRTTTEMEKEEKRRVFVPKGTQCQIDVVNLRESIKRTIENKSAH